MAGIKNLRANPVGVCYNKICGNAVSMIRILGKIPTRVTLACSGGIDSMAVLDFLLRGKKKVSVAYFNHGTEHGDIAEKFVRSYCKDKNIPFTSGFISRERNNDESPEEHWRNERYKFFNSLSGKIVTAHHLDDVIEWWVFTSLHGDPRLMPSSNGKIIRPFLSTKKEDLLNWSRRKSVPFVYDPSNSEVRYSRNRIRHNIIPQMMEINPGLSKVIRKKIEAREAGA